MTKQVFELISDATVLSDIHSLAAVILRIKGSNESNFITAYKRLFIFKATDSSQAELLAGLHGIKYLISLKNIEQIEIQNSSWLMDLPHIDSIIKKQKQAPQFPDSCKEILDLITENNLKIRLPKGSKELQKHHLCHRMCTLGRVFFQDDASIQSFLSNFSSHLKKIESEWIILDQ